MIYSKKFFWVSFLGGIAIAAAIAGVLYLKDANRMSKLEKAYAGWVIAEGKVTSFQARFPKEPEYAAQDLPIPNSGEKLQQEIYVGGDDELSYFVSATLYPAEVAGDEEKNLRGALDGMVRAIPGGEIVSSRYEVPFSGANYLEYKLHSTQNNTSYKGRMFLSSRSLYQTYVLYKELAYNDDKYTYFVNSFQIK